MMYATGAGRLSARLWHSPTVTTWASLGTRAVSIVVILPLVLNRLEAAEILLWYLFATIIGLRMLIDIGFVATFIRVISYAMGGATDIRDLRDPEAGSLLREPNWESVSAIVTTSHFIYVRLAVFLVVVFSTLGTWSLWRPVGLTGDQTSAWFAWAVIVAITAISLYGNVYRAYLQGINEIALFRRWETVAWIGATVSSIAVWIAGGGLLELLMANQAWTLINVMQNRWLCMHTEGGRFSRFRERRFDPSVFAAVWPSAWRSGLGVLMSAGLVQASGIAYAQFGIAAAVAPYLLALNLMQHLTQFSAAPFYSKIPALARLHSQGQLEQQVALAKRGMRWAFWVFALGVVGIGLLIEPAMALVDSNIQFLDHRLWALLGLALFVERYGAMHIQLYSTTNHIIWHIANAGAGALYVAASIVLFPLVGLAAFPLGILLGYLGFSAWYSAKHSYRAFRLKMLPFERATSLGPLLTIVIYGIIVLAL